MPDRNRPKGRVVTVFKSRNVSSLADGTHFIRAYDLAGNLTEISFIVDNTPPSFYVQNYYKTGDIIDITFYEDNVSLILFAGVPVASLYFIADELSEGNHTVRVVDLARNATEKSFTVDLAAPELVIMKNSAATQDGTHLKAGDTFSIQVSDTYLAAVFFDGEPTSTRLCNADNLDECAHIIVVSDLAGNRSEAKFTVDKTAPSFSLNAYYLVGETIVLDIDEVNGYTVFLDGIETPNLTFFANDLSEALHTVTVIDLARNSAARTFTVDLSAPVLTLSGFSLDGQAELLDDGGFFTFVSPKSKDSFSNWICRHRYICLAFCMMPHRLPIVIS